MGFEPTGPFRSKRFSRASRYDHFGTPPKTRHSTLILPKVQILYIMNNGSVPERLNGPHSKCGIGVTLSEVRILPLPPIVFKKMKQEKTKNVIRRFHLEYSISIVLIFLSIYFWITFLNHSLIKIIGLLTNIVGLIMWQSARMTLGENWNTDLGKPEIKRLVTHGIYSKIRHPIYWGMILTLIGLILLNPNLWFSIVSLLIMIYFFYRMGLENNYLSENLGEKYENYKRKTWI